MQTFSKETLLADLKARYAYLNDNDATALKIYDIIMNSKK